jgi:hypothetical protein
MRNHMTTITDPRKIQHVVLAHSGDIEQEMRGEVLTEAYKNFGYSADSFDARGPLAKVLASLEIQPLDGGQVAEYMTSKAGESEFSVGVWFHIIVTVIALGYIAFGFSHYPQFGAHDGSQFHDYKGGVDWFAVGFLSVFPGILGGALLNAVAAGISAFFPKTHRSWIWNKFTLGRGNGSYRRYVPVYVLNLANQIKSEIPEATFVVHELTSQIEKIQEPLPDPFLSVALNGESYFIAVWDEREFEARA